MIKALLPALAFFGSVAYATSGTGQTGKKAVSRSVKSTGSGFLDSILPEKSDSPFQRV
jgi:hypothetical protein